MTFPAVYYGFLQMFSRYSSTSSLWGWLVTLNLRFVSMCASMSNLCPNTATIGPSIPNQDCIYRVKKMERRLDIIRSECLYLFQYHHLQPLRKGGAAVAQKLPWFAGTQETTTLWTRTLWRSQRWTHTEHSVVLLSENGRFIHSRTQYRHTCMHTGKMWRLPKDDTHLYLHTCLL